MVAVFTCQFLFSFPSAGDVWRCQHSFLLRAEHTCSGNAGWTSLRVVIGAGWFLQHKHAHSSLSLIVRKQLVVSLGLDQYAHVFA